MRLLAPRLGLLLVFPVLAGCAPKVGHVTGRVTYRGNPVPAGWIQFRPADAGQNSVTAALDADGNFSADLPAGEVTVSIDNREWEPRSEGAVPSLPPGLPISAETRAKLAAQATSKKDEVPRERTGKYLPIPEKYYDASTSGLTFKVKGGNQTENFELTD